MASNTQPDKTKQASQRPDSGADRVKRTPSQPESQHRSPTGRDEKLIGAKRFPRKGDDEESA